MRIDSKKLIPQDVTIINKLKKTDSATGIEIWYKKKLKNCVWKLTEVMEQNGTNTNIGASISVLLPQEQATSYLTYKDWKNNPDAGWTISLDDYIVLGDVSENVTANNIVSLMQAYKPNSCKIKTFEDLTSNDGVKMAGFLGLYANIYAIGGV